jgi:hypothetical protein
MNFYDICDEMCVHDALQGSLLRSSVAQTIDCNLRVQAPGFRTSAFPLLGSTLRAQGYCRLL